MTIQEKETIEILENRNVNVADPYFSFFPSSYLMKELSISKYKALKILNGLRAKGIVSYGHFGGGCDCSINESNSECYCESSLPVWAWKFNGEHKNTYYA